MIRNELKDWLDEHASELLSEWHDADLSTLPTGWSMQEKAVDHYGGEDQGSDYWTVWQFNHQDGGSVLIRIQGWYQSYNGSEFESYKQVTKQEKTVIVYE